jgi:predicted ATPase/DNA-binding CsgD family transcriptional regulator
MPVMDGPATGDGGRLPAPLTSFVGREQHVFRIARLLKDQRLITLVGVGGVGKTRMALAVAGRVADRFDGGARLVELGALADPTLVARAVAGALGLADEQVRPPAEAVAAALRAAELLLVLDTCEHLLPAAAALAEQLLRSCPRLRVLATSRESLGVPGETVWRVPPLTLPYPREPARPDRLLRSEAVRLFVERARTAQPEFRLTPQNAPAVAEICDRLDGLPLAIELAAARTNVLTPEQIAERLGDRFSLLTAGPRTVLPRQQTLRGTLDWSYGLLEPDRRAHFAQLAVFAGGWTLDAAASLWGECGESGALGVLADLIEKSLVVADVAGRSPARYRLMETVREYAWERLRASGSEAQVRQRHADYFLDLAERAEPMLRGPDQMLWLDRLEVEHNNLRAAFEWLTRADDPCPPLRLAAALGWFWFLKGHRRDGRAWWQRLPASAESAAVPAAARARALVAVGFLAEAEYDLAAARRMLEAGAELAQRSEDPRLVGTALARLGYLRMHEGRLDAAAELLDEALAHHRTVGDEWGAAFALMALAHVALHRGDPAGAAPLARQSLELFRPIGDRWGMARALHGVGQAAFDEGDYRRAEAAWRERVRLARELRLRPVLAHGLDLVGTAARLRGDWRRAVACYEESLSLRQAAGDRRGAAWTLHYLALGACHGGDAAKARTLLTESLAIRREVGEPRWVAVALEGFAALAVAEGRPRAAVRLDAAATALRGAGEPRTPLEGSDLRPWLDRARAQLAPAAAAALWAEGESLPVEDSVELALSNQPEPGGTRRRPTGEVAAGLTAREREVVALIARGLTNRQIAERLVIAAGTAGVHVAHVLAKLDVHSRAQVAAWAVEHGLGAPAADHAAESA